MKDNELEPLYSKFKDKKFVIQHDLKTKENQARILAWKALNFKENHLLKIQFPENPEHPELKPENEEVVLYAFRRGELLGRDFLGLLYDTFDGIIKKIGGLDVLERDNNPNPANIPLGKAYWRVVKSEVDLTTTRKPLGNVLSLQHVWGGWSLKKKKLDQLLADLRVKFEKQVPSFRLIEAEAFNNVEKIDFYRVTANLSVLPSGAEKLKALVLQPNLPPEANTPPKRAKSFLGRLVGKLKGNSKYRPEDAALYKDLVTLIGEGDFDKGKQLYDEKCKAEKDRQTNSETKSNSGEWKNGVYFDCLSNWTEKLLKLSKEAPKDKKQEAEWLANVLAILDQNIPMSALFGYLGEPNYIFVIRVNGFRTGDEDGDLEFFSNSYGDPKQNLEISGGLITYWANKTRIMPVELERSQGSFK